MIRREMEEKLRTVKECLHSADRKDILGWLAYDFLSDPISLLEVQDHTVREIQEKYKAHMSRFIDALLETEPIPDDGKVLFLADSMLNGRKDREVLLCDIHEILENPDAPYYDCGFTEWRRILGYRVADNRLTQNHIDELLAVLLSEMSWMGIEETAWKDRRREIEEKLDQSMKELEEGKGIPADQVSREIREEFGFPIDEDDPEQDELRGLVTEAQVRFTEYSRKRERDRILRQWQKEHE